MAIERRRRGGSGRPGGEHSVGSGRTIRPQDCGKRAPKPTIYLAYRAQEVYPLSPLIRGGFQRRGGVPYQHESKFLTVFTNEPSGVSERSCPTRILWVWGSSPSGVTNSFRIGDSPSGVSQSGCHPTFSRLAANFGRPGANNPLARGEQSENAPQNESIIGRKRFTLSALSSGEVSKGGGGRSRKA